MVAQFTLRSYVATYLTKITTTANQLASKSQRISTLIHNNFLKTFSLYYILNVRNIQKILFRILVKIG